jgi:uncharacterized protein YjbI with pentapeptide repeats
VLTWSPEDVIEGETIEGFAGPGPSAHGVRVLDCELRGGTMTGGDLSRGTWRRTAMSGIRLVGVGLSRTAWTDVELDGCALSGCELFGVNWRRVRLRDCRLDAVNLRGSQLREVVFEDCQVRELGSAELVDVRWPGCRIERLDLTGVTLDRFDLRGAEFGLSRGFDRLRGAVIDQGQLFELAAALADHLGLDVRSGSD